MATVREEYLGFVEKVLQKASRYSFLMEGSIIYCELAHDLEQDLKQRYLAKLNDEYPSAKLPKKASIRLLMLTDLVFGLFAISCLLVGDVFGFTFFLGSTILLSFWLLRIIFSFRKREKMKLDLLGKYSAWLNSIKESSHVSRMYQ